MSINISAAVSAAQVTALKNCFPGTLTIYDGTQPASADTPITDQNALVVFPIVVTDWSIASLTIGVMSLDAGDSSPLTWHLTAHNSVAATGQGKAAWFRFASNSLGALWDGPVDIADNLPNLIVDSTGVMVGGTVYISRYQLRVELA